MQKLLLSIFLIINLAGPQLFAQFLSPSWTAVHNGKASSYDNAVQMTKDTSGNIIVVENTDVSGNGSDDIVTIKYDKFGTLLWTAVFNGDNNYIDTPSDICTDKDGNIYITGSSYGTSDSKDFLVLKYNKDGVQQWVKTFNGDNDGYDYGIAIKTDNAGYVYVTGYYSNSTTEDDIITMKLDQAGNVIWQNQFNGNGNDDDHANAIAIDNAGNVSVTGTTYTSNSYKDIITIKYNNTGDTLWTRTIDGSRNSNDEAKAIAADNAGNIYVAGNLNNKISYLDYTIVKYNPEGVLKWVKSYNGTADDDDEVIDIATDNKGYVYATGHLYNSSQGYDILTVKTDSTGNEQWISQYNNPDDWSDKSQKLVVDKWGNTYVTGTSDRDATAYDVLLLKYDSSGNEKWIHTINGTENSGDAGVSLLLSNTSQPLILGTLRNLGTGNDVALAAIDSLGNPDWIKNYDAGSNSSDKATAMVLDKAGNIYVTGSSYNGRFSKDITTIKYDKNGAQQWIRKYNGPSDNDDSGIAIALDNSGNVFVTGTVYNDTSRSDIIVLKYETNGNLLWSKTTGGTASYYDYVNDIAVDKDGNVYITGTVENNDTYNDIITLKYTSDGTKLWAKILDRDESYDEGVAIAVAASGDVIITGITTFHSSYEDFTTVKYDPNGNVLWQKVEDGTSHDTDAGLDLSLDKDGNTYVTGYTTNIGAGKDFTVIKYDVAGTRKWIKTYNTLENEDDEARYLCLDDSANVYISGSAVNAGTKADITTIKYNNAGKQQWVASYSGKANGDDEAKGIVADKNGHVFVTGSAREGNTNDIVTISYNPDGTEYSMTVYDGESQDTDDASAIAIDNNAIYIAGAVTNTGYETDMALIKYCDFIKPNLIAGGPTAICDGETVKLNATKADAYTWSNGLTTPSVDASLAGNYFVRLTNLNSCSINSDTIAVTVKAKPAVSLQYSLLKGCDGDTINIAVNPQKQTFSYLWSNGEKTGTLQAKISGNYYVTVKDTNNCSTQTSTVGVNIKPIPLAAPICIVSVDSDSKSNSISWEKPSPAGIDSFRISREGTNGFVPVVTLAYAAFSEYSDTLANPNLTSYKYTLSVIDTCGNESPLSDAHRTLFLQANRGVGSVVNLNWTPYEGRTISYYRIMRDDAGTGNFKYSYGLYFKC